MLTDTAISAACDGAATKSAPSTMSPKINNPGIRIRRSSRNVGADWLSGFRPPGSVTISGI